MGIGDKIKDALGGGEHTEAADRGEVDQRTPGSFPSEAHSAKETSVPQSGVDQPHVGDKPVPSSGQPDLGGTAADPLLQGKQHNVLHKKDDPRGHAHTDSGVGLTQPKHEDSHNTHEGSHSHPLQGQESASDNTNSTTGQTAHSRQDFNSPASHDDANRSATAGAVGTGVAAAGAGGLAAHELGGDRSGQKHESAGTPNFSSSIGTEQKHNSATPSTDNRSVDNPESAGIAGIVGSGGKDHHNDHTHQDPTHKDHTHKDHTHAHGDDRTDHKSKSSGIAGILGSSSKDHQKDSTHDSTENQPGHKSESAGIAGILGLASKDHKKDHSTTTTGDQSVDKKQSSGLSGILGSNNKNHGHDTKTTSTGGLPASTSSNTYAPEPSTAVRAEDSRGSAHDATRGPSAGIAGATVGALGSGESHNTVHNGSKKSEVHHEEPYWGNIPQGAGTYNSVTGHGSNEDTSQQHRAVPVTGSSQEPPATSSVESHPRGTGVYNTVVGHGSAHDDSSHVHHPHETDTSTSSTRAIGAGQPTTATSEGSSKASALDSTHPSNTGTGHSKVAALDPTHSSTQQDTREREKDSNTGKHAAEAGAGAGIGAKIHQLLHRNKEDKEEKVKESGHHADTSKHSHHDAKHEDTKTKHHHHDAAAAPVSKSGDNHSSRHAHEPSGATESPRGTEGLYQDSTREHDHRAAAGLAGLGAGGAAAYGASKLARGNDEQHGLQSSSTASPGNTVASGLSGMHPSTVSEATPAGASSGYTTTAPDTRAAGVTGSHPTTVSDVASTGTTDKYASSSHAPSTGYPSATSMDRDNTGLPKDDSHSKHVAAGVAGLGAGAGAAYGVSNLSHAHDHQTDTGKDVPSTQSSIGQSHPSTTIESTQKATGLPSATGAKDSPYNTLPSGTASGVHSANGADQSGRQGTSSTTKGDDGPYNTLGSGTDSGIHSEAINPHQSATTGSAANNTSAADDGPYNTLASGTPSGVHLK